MQEQTQQSKKQELMRELRVSFERGLFTYEDFLQSLDKVLSDFFVEAVEVSLFRSLFFDVIKVKED